MLDDEPDDPDADEPLDDDELLLDDDELDESEPPALTVLLVEVLRESVR
ncbi:hypothetical protein APR03_001944 [Promicromonospora thailandica]|uniref:Uncharacterized protein n=1 Tax=Promicromonospora thailandica TaxID=765201 RepID=A0A9X2G9V6_9MICO|nr:hypothetical protein [Promicromonospora thailandica]BFF20326.1 hypothetical protein GCM10025730_38470 [Promicromonospora thailandica]